MEIRIQDIVERLKAYRQLEGVLIATEDGLPMAGSMPGGPDANTWSGFGPQFFREFDKEAAALSLGTPRRCVIVLQDRCFTIWREAGVYLILSHALDQISPEFEEQNAVLIREIARRCEQQPATA